MQSEREEGVFVCVKPAHVETQDSHGWRALGTCCLYLGTKSGLFVLFKQLCRTVITNVRVTRFQPKFHLANEAVGHFSQGLT